MRFIWKMAIMAMRECHVDWVKLINGCSAGSLEGCFWRPTRT